MPTGSVPPVRCLDYDDENWELKVTYHDGRRYTYQAIPYNWYDKLMRWKKRKNHSAIIKFLQRCAKREAEYVR